MRFIHKQNLDIGQSLNNNKKTTKRLKNKTTRVSTLIDFQK